MNADRLYLYLYILVWALTFLVYFRKKKTFDAGACLILAYLIYAIFSYFAYFSYYYGGDFQELKLFPFIYLYLSVMIVMSPVLRANTSEEVTLVHPDLKLFRIFCIIVVSFTFIRIPVVISNFWDGLIKILTTDYGGADLYAETLDGVEDSGHGITNLFAILSGAFFSIAILLFFYSLTIPNLKRTIKLLLTVPCITAILHGIGTGQRGAMVQPLLAMMVTYFALYKHMPKKINRMMARFGIIAVVLISIPFMALTISRFDTVNSNVNESMINYAGQSSLYFNNYALDDGGIRYGDRTIPLLKRMIGIPDVPRNFIERRIKYPHLKINDEHFCTFVGDITIDFGPFWGFIIMVIVTSFLLVKTRQNGGKLYFHQLILLHFIMYLCIIGGLKLYPFSDTSGNLKLLVYIMTYLLFKYKTMSNVQQ